MTILDPRYQGFLELTDSELQSLQSINHIRSDAILVRTSIGGAVWIDPLELAIVQKYKLGQLKGDETPLPTGVLFRAMPNPPVFNQSSTGSISFNGFTPPAAFVATPTQQIQGGSKYLQIRIGVYSGVKVAQKQLTVNVDVFPAIPAFVSSSVSFPWTLEINPIPLPIQSSILNASRRLLANKVSTYFDQDRIGKTLLNFGNDYQSLLLNWKYDASDTTGATIFTKLYQPLPLDVTEFTEAWISRTLSPTYLDQLYIVYIPGQGLRIYLRPPNKSLNVQGISGNEISNATLQSLLTTGSLDKTSYSDPIIQEWFVTSLEGAELNTEYNKFNKFVFYSSAVKRLEAFKQKLLLLEDYSSILSEQSQSIASITTGLSGFTGSVAYAGYQRIAEQKMDLIRSFDGYERFLYYGSGSAYSSSFSDDGGEVDQMYYLSDATWPKVNGSIISVASASNSALYSVAAGTSLQPEGDFSGIVSWWDAITFIAEEYDRQNQNRLANQLPSYLSSDDQSADFVTFIDMIGHHFDVVKLYADHMPDIYRRDNDPTVGLSPDLVWNIAASFGIELPNQYAVKQLVDYTIGEIGQVSPTVYRQVAAETWKRFLHNQIYILKSKGTRNALRGLLNSYGVLPTTIQIRETATPSFYLTQSYELIEEQTNTLIATSGSYITIPYSGSGLDDPQTIQIRFSTTEATQSAIFNVGNTWALQLQPLSSSYGTVAVISGSTLITSSSVFQIYNGDYYNVTLQHSGTILKLWTIRSDDDGDLVNYSYTTGSFNGWLSGSSLFLGSNTKSFGVPFNGFIDEFRIWSELTTQHNIELHAKYPGLYNGNHVTSSRDHLPVRLSFGKPRNLGTGSITSRFVLNESPYIRVAGRNAMYTQFSASNYSNSTTYPYSMDVITRNVLRYSPNAGGNQFVSNKIIVADSPALRYFNGDSGSTIPVLSHEKSIVPLNDKFDKTRSNNVVGFYFSTVDAINDSIIRTIGNVDIQDYIGSPSDMFESSYTDLMDLNNIYWTYYAYTYNYNSFIEFVENLLQPLFEQAKKLVPARSKLLTGIVVESPILERNKVKWTRPELSGQSTLHESVTPTLFPDALTSEPATIDADVTDHEATLVHDDIIQIESFTNDIHDSVDLTETYTLDTQYDSIESEIDSENLYIVEGLWEPYDGTIDSSDFEDVSVDFLTIDDDTARFDYFKYLLRKFNITSPSQLSGSNKAYFSYMLSTFKPGASYQVQTGLNSYLGDNTVSDTINPYIDFSNIGHTQYFTQIDGLVAIVQQQRVRVNQSVLISAGTWTKGTTYSRNQYVTQSGQTGNAMDGNGLEYVCVTPLASGSFISYNPPSLDGENWRQIKYTYIPSFTIRVASLVDDSVELVNSGSGYTPFLGYTSKHYRFNRDTRLGTKRRLWLGCKQTDDTTPDGKPAVEIIPSAGDSLVVSTGADPIQLANDVTGPILDVR